MKKNRTYGLAVGGMIAALYATVSLAFAPLSFGVVQIRFSEALTLLAVFSPIAIWGVTVGCLLTNLIGVGLGITMPPDVIFGTLATLIAAMMSYRMRDLRLKGLPIPASLPPILVNALIIGLELTLFYSNGFDMGIFLSNAAAVGAGQIIPCAVLGVLLVSVLERAKIAQKLFVVHPYRMPPTEQKDL